jgi:hypothetical protein
MEEVHSQSLSRLCIESVRIHNDNTCEATEELLELQRDRGRGRSIRLSVVQSETFLNLLYQLLMMSLSARKAC